MGDAQRISLRAAAVALIGTALTFVTGLLMGFAARALQSPFDVPVYAALERAYQPDGWWTSVTALFTQIGDPLPMVWQVAAVSLAAAATYGRRWWVPAVALPATLGLEWLMQKSLEFVIDRGHPPAGTGTFPSGGSARFVAIYGVMVLLALIRWPHVGNRWRVVLFAAVAAASLFEGYTRLYLLKHWPTDIPAGLIMGAMILATMSIVLAQLGRRGAR